MLEVKIPYSPQESNIFGTISRPLVTIKVYSKIKNVWIPIYDTLADTGADITLLPRYLGEMIVDDITTGKYIEIKGIVPNAILIGFIHILKLEVYRKEFETKVVIADSDDARPIFGRFNGLDLFEVTFNKGKHVVIR
jgi:hypothetical protein